MVLQGTVKEHDLLSCTWRARRAGTRLPLGATATIKAKAIPHADWGHLATAKRLHELLEAAGLWLSGSAVVLARLAQALLRHLMLGKILGTVLELGLGRASGSGHVTQTSSTTNALARITSGAAWPISLLAHLLDRGWRRRLFGV